MRLQACREDFYKIDPAIMSSLLHSSQHEHPAAPQLSYGSKPDTLPRFQLWPRLTSKRSLRFNNETVEPLNRGTSTPTRLFSMRNLDAQLRHGPPVKQIASSLPQSRSNAQPLATTEALPPCSPPLAEALGTAALRELLYIPSKKHESSARTNITRRKGSISRPISRKSNSYHTHNVSLPSQTHLDHSDLHDVTLTPKLILLDKLGHVIQYSIDGALNRFPERSLQLGPGTTAIASDILPGKHWVLSIVEETKKEQDVEEQANSVVMGGLRSRLRSRSSIHRNQPEQLLLVFDDSSCFNRWLITVRKAIEAVGGPQYRPDSREKDSKIEQPEERPKQATAGSTAQYSATPAISPLRTRSYTTERPPSDSTSLSPVSPISPAPSLCQDSATDSSVISPIDFDQARTPNRKLYASSSGSRTKHEEHVAVDVIPIHSPKLERSSERLRSSGIVKQHGRKPAPGPISLKDQRSNLRAPALPSPNLPRTPTLPVDTLHTLAGKFDPEDSSDVQKPTEAVKMSNWLDQLIEARKDNVNDSLTHGQKLQPQSSQRSSQMTASSSQLSDALEYSVDILGIANRSPERDRETSVHTQATSSPSKSSNLLPKASLQPTDKSTSQPQSNHQPTLRANRGASRRTQHEKTHVMHQKSLPNLAYRNGSVLSPPPSVPLPAVPTKCARTSSPDVFLQQQTISNPKSSGTRNTNQHHHRSTSTRPAAACPSSFSPPRAREKCTGTLATSCGLPSMRSTTKKAAPARVESWVAESRAHLAASTYDQMAVPPVVLYGGRKLPKRSSSVPMLRSVATWSPTKGH